MVLVGPSGSGKSTFAKKHFLATEVVSSDVCRGLISDDETDQTVSSEAFDLVHTIAGKRLALGKLTVIDATNVQREYRKPLVAVARKYHCLPVAVVFKLPQKVCQERNDHRTDRNIGRHVIRRQFSQMHRSIKGLRREGFRHVFVLDSEEKMDAAEVRREPLWNDKRDLIGPFDIIGDVHGCSDELEALLRELGYVQTKTESGDGLWGDVAYGHPDGRMAIFLGDLVDRGPRVLDAVRIARNMTRAGAALCTPGNHEIKLLRKLRGKNVRVNHGLDNTLAELEALPEKGRDGFVHELRDFLYGLVSHYVLDKGRLVVAHAGMKQEMQGRGSGKVRDFALFGETTGETDEFGLPVRWDWASEYRGPAMVVYGHTPVPEPEWLNRTVNIDTGCVFGGRLTAMRYPEKEYVSVPARKTWCEPAKPFLPEEDQAPALSAQQAHDHLLDAGDVLGKRIISTRLRPNITINEENAAAALENMSRFAVDPRWLIYLSPTMSPCETSVKEGFLEHPAEAFSYYRSMGVHRVVCEEKHMGSRAIVVVCRDAEAARKRFGVEEDGAGVVYTRTGRRFFDDGEMEEAFLSRIREAMSGSGFWEEFHTDWACLDSELMPWSTKARALLKTQYAAVGAASKAALSDVLEVLERTASREDLEKKFETSAHASNRPSDIDGLLDWSRRRLDMTRKYVEAYRRYCWPVQTLDDMKLAPFHLLAAEKAVFVDRDHVWHMETLAKICEKDEKMLLATNHEVIDVTDPASQERGVRWWEEMTEKGGEGMVVKPRNFIARGRRGLIQPAVKVRGREYLRIIYGPEYTADVHLQRLRSRGLGKKRSLALREFALGVEALARFVRGEPLRSVHECVFGILALESEPVDPRL